MVKYEKEVMEHNLKLYKTGTNSYKQTGNLDRFTKPFRIRHQEDRFPNYDWEKLAEHNFSDLLVKVEISIFDHFRYKMTILRMKMASILWNFTVKCFNICQIHGHTMTENSKIWPVE